MSKSDYANEPNNDAAWERSFAELARRSGLHHLPTDVYDALLDKFRQRRVTRQTPAFWQRLTAVLAYDSMQALLPTGARTTRMTEGRQLVFATDQGDIALDIQPQEGALAIHGHLLIDASEQTHLVQLLLDDTEQAVAMSDEIGEFSLVDVMPGTYSLLIVGDTYELAIDELVLA